MKRLVAVILSVCMIATVSVGMAVSDETLALYRELSEMCEERNGQAESEYDFCLLSAYFMLCISKGVIDGVELHDSLDKLGIDSSSSRKLASSNYEWMISKINEQMENRDYSLDYIKQICDIYIESREKAKEAAKQQMEDYEKKH